MLVAVTAIAHYEHAYGVRENVAEGASGGFVIGTDLRLVALVAVAVVPSFLLAVGEAESWATAAVWALSGLVAASSTVRSLQAWTTPNGPDGSTGAASPSDLSESTRHNGQSTDRMQTVNAETGMSVPRQAIGGVR